ncbi:MAG: SMP-30/gluconolactonase/LRE family protein, partial [Burkholderiales bacterium]
MHGLLETIAIEVDLCAPGWERIIDPSPPVDIIARDIIFGEGPTWDARGKQLFFTDIIGDTIWKWRPGIGQEVVRAPSVKANGTCLDLENRLVVAGWGGRTVFRMEKNGTWKTLADKWQ